ncbi:hypothetical protein [Streptomyces sp. NPDC048650]|uniref:hypothetical protein n=1 Tax=unclassified Streptomyces TaxID=2593676 RepID=UPI00371B42D0
MTGLRRLPWDGPDGKPAYLSTDDRRSLLSRLADEVEQEQLDTARTVVRLVRELLADTRPATPDDVRFAALRQNECLTDLLRVAEARGTSAPPQPDDFAPPATGAPSPS